jgi:hypothetical protein
MRHPSERAVLSRASIQSLWRLARFLGVTRKECHCSACHIALVEHLARRMEQIEPAAAKHVTRP